jgi:hypothetical protein
MIVNDEPQGALCSVAKRNEPLHPVVCFACSGNIIKINIIVSSLEL